MIYYEQGDYVKKWEKLSENEIKDIFAKSISQREVARKIGYKNSINYFGGEEEFLKKQEYDLKKRKYCLENSIPLNLIKYDEKITEERVLNFYDTKRIKFKPYT